MQALSTDDARGSGKCDLPQWVKECQFSNDPPGKSLHIVTDSSRTPNCRSLHHGLPRGRFSLTSPAPYPSSSSSNTTATLPHRPPAIFS